MLETILNCSYPVLIYSRILSSCVLPDAVTQYRVAAGDPECSRTCLAGSVPDIWVNVKQDFKPCPYSHGHRETIGNAASLAGLGASRDVWRKRCTLSFVTPVLEQVAE